jgi:hypothetical protein
MGGHRHESKSLTLTIDSKLRRAITDSERLLKQPVGETLKRDHITIDFHEDGYPKLPECLDRRSKPLLAEVA